MRAKAYIYLSVVANLLILVSTNTHTTYRPQTLEEKIEEVLTREINNNNPYSETPVLLTGQQLYPVIFEPIKHIKLSRSTYKITSFIDFTPYIRTFNTFERYLEQVIADMSDPNRVGALRFLDSVTNPYIKENPTFFAQMIKGVSLQKCVGPYVLKACQEKPYPKSCYRDTMIVCNMKKRFSGKLKVARHIKKEFTRIKGKFLEAIDHIKKGEKKGGNSTRNKREAEDREYLEMFSKKMTPEEERIIDEIMNKILEYSPEIHEKVSRHKRFSIMTWVMGWGVWSNARNIKHIKKNIKTLYQQNLLQEKQIQDLAQYLNLTATQVQLQGKQIYEINNRLEQLNFSLLSLDRRLDQTEIIGGILHDLGTTTNRLMIGLISIKNNVEKIYEYMRVMATHTVHPALIPPPALRDLLVHVKEKMKENPRLELPYDPEIEIWKYYEIMKITPLVVDDLMIILLTIPLSDQSLAMNVYRAHNLPAVSPEHKLAARYHLEGEYLAVGKHGLYVALPDSRDIHLCQASQGGLCVMNQALHPVDLVEWCIYALFIQDEEKIKKNCIMDFKDRKANLAQSLGGYMWAISSLVGEKIQIRCLTETHVVEIKPPLQIIHVGNGCEGYSPSIMIPARSELTSQYQIEDRVSYFLEFNEEYEKIEVMGPWMVLPLDKIPKEQIEKIVKRLPELPPMSYEHLNMRLQAIDEDYPFSVPVPVLFVSQVVGFGLVVLGGIGVSWKMYKMRGDLTNMVKNIVKGEFKGKETQKMLTTLMDVYAGVAPPRSIKAPPTTTTQKLTIQEIPHASIQSRTAASTSGTTKVTISSEEKKKKTEGEEIEQMVLQVLKKGTDVKKLGKYYEKQQKKKQED